MQQVCLMTEEEIKELLDLKKEIKELKEALSGTTKKKKTITFLDIANEYNISYWKVKQLIAENKFPKPLEGFERPLRWDADKVAKALEGDVA